MTPDQWHKIKEVVAAASGLRQAERRPFVERACGQDRILFDEAWSLLKEDVSDLEQSDALPTAGAPALSDATAGAGFTPGTILAARYRIVALLGRGGMGEVYRADDLKLGQAVALKFLPRAFASDPKLRERFFKEVRITRHLSHPNICRVYDIAEFDGQHFLSMEYIDGEDLASLIKRIGYLSNEKALEITRQLLAGLAAAHERGVLHQDLKPANIMLDGHGRVRIMDFGIAVATGDETVEGQIVGTPAYMAPEQFAGMPATERSDIYSLGLVLYEIYCGKRAVGGAGFYSPAKQEGLTPPSEVRQGVDPVSERLIMRCLERDPGLRPASVAQLAAALPGGDPLAAAIAAGESPSPEMVAASGLEGTLRVHVAFAALLCFVLVSATVLLLSERVMLYRVVPFNRPPEVLADRASEIIKMAGYDTAPADRAGYFSYNGDYIAYLSRTRSGKVGPQANLYSYVVSPRPLVPNNTQGRVTTDDPPITFPGMTRVILDSTGRLVRFQSFPPDTASGLLGNNDWNGFLASTGLVEIEPGRSDWTPPVPYDTKVAWSGLYPDEPNIRMEVVGASFQGRPVFFRVTGPWTQPVGTRAPFSRISQLTLTILSIIALAASGILARRNIRLGRGDRVGARRVALFIAIAMLIAWLLEAHHVTAVVDEYQMFVRGAGTAFFTGVLIWTIYLALATMVACLRAFAFGTCRRVVQLRIDSHSDLGIFGMC